MMHINTQERAETVETALREANATKFVRGRLYQFNRMKLERPMWPRNPTYWDYQERNEIDAALSVPTEATKDVK